MNAIETKAPESFDTPHAAGPIVLQFTGKTPGEVYDYTIDSIDKAFGVIAELGDLELLRQGELRLQDFAARLHNAQAKLKGRIAERATFEELREQPSGSPKAWTIINGKRVEGEVL